MIDDVVYLDEGAFNALLVALRRASHVPMEQTAMPTIGESEGQFRCPCPCPSTFFRHP